MKFNFEIKVDNTISADKMKRGKLYQLVSGNEGLNGAIVQRWGNDIVIIGLNNGWTYGCKTPNTMRFIEIPYGTTFTYNKNN